MERKDFSCFISWLYLVFVKEVFYLHYYLPCILMDLWYSYRRVGLAVGFMVCMQAAFYMQMI